MVSDKNFERLLAVSEKTIDLLLIIGVRLTKLEQAVFPSQPLPPETKEDESPDTSNTDHKA